MRYNMDLHIHSVLSPCADLLMGYTNIISKLKENDIKIFSITDHNAIGNVNVFQKIAGKENLIFIPGIELQSAEEIHLLAYFRTVNELEDFYKVLEPSLSPFKNDEEVFGYQVLIDEDDEFTGQVEAFYAGSLSLGIDEIFALVKEKNGLIIPAHLDKTSSIISNLGYIPDMDFDGFEIYIPAKIPEYKQKYKITKPILSSSDAHIVESIGTAKMEIELENLDIETIFNSIKEGKVYIKYS